MTPLDNSIPFGFCQCGCGRKTKIAHQSHTVMGWVKGQPIRFIVGHHKVKRRSEVQYTEIDGMSCALLPLSSGELAMVDLDDLEQVRPYFWVFENGYARSAKGGKMHRLIARCPDGMEVDHINGNRLDNRRSNLRIVTHAQNVLNTRIRDANRSGVVGVYFEKCTGKWRAALQINGWDIKLGRFASKDDAIKARRLAEEKYHGEFSLANSRKHKLLEGGK
jgi:HNH endonuclease